MRFRKAKKEDIPQMHNILRTNSPKYPKTLALQELDEMFSNALIKPTYIIAEHKDEILAFGGFTPSWIDNRVFNIFWVNTNHTHQNQGVGSKLMENLINRIRNTRNIRAKMILVSTKISAFYNKFGFKRITSKYDGEYILMSLNVN